ncbi:cobaltochelatase subunit CobN [Pseudomonas sp. Marseille-QA0892]
MHMLSAMPGGYVDESGATITRLDQTPGDIVILSAADTTLALLASAHPRATDSEAAYPEVRLANLVYLRQNASVDLYIDEVLQHAKVIVIDHLGGESYWPYGTEQVVALCRRKGIVLAMFSGDMAEDPNLTSLSTADAEVCHTLWRYLREGGASNAASLYAYLGALYFDMPCVAAPPAALPPISIHHPLHQPASVSDWHDRWHPGAPCVAVLFYRSHLQAGNTRVFDELCEQLLSQGLNPLPIALLSLKDKVCLTTLRHLCAEHCVAVILNSTAFAHSAIDDPGDHALVGDIPVLQVMLSSGNQEGWMADPHGLQPRDMAMQVALPEVDGRIISRAFSFKGLGRRSGLTQCDVVEYHGHTERMAFVAELTRRWARLRELPNAEKRLALILANYPTREGRLGNGVGLDTPASVINILRRLQTEGYRVDDVPEDGEQLMAALRQGITNDPDQWAIRPARQSLSMGDYRAFFATLPAESQQAVIDRWGMPEQDPMLRQGRFMLAGLRMGSVFVGIQPARGYNLDEMANYHDPDLVPPHHYLAFYAWLRTVWACDAIVHVGKHGNLEWLPGKSVALSQTCWPDLIFGPMPHLYPFIVNDPGEGTQAKRRTQAVIIDHLMPPLTRAESYGPTRDLERLIDEFYDALTLDPRRAGLLRKQILALIVTNNLHEDLGMPPPATEEDEQHLLNRTDTYLCELKESQIRDGLHVFGESPAGRLERDTLLALARYGVGDGKSGNAGLVRALAQDLLPADAFDPSEGEWGEPWLGARPAVLTRVSSAPWRSRGDTRERLELLALELLAHRLDEVRTDDGPFASSDVDALICELPTVAAVLRRVDASLRPRLSACGPQELLQLCRGLEGRFVPPGPSGAPTRGRPDVLPTGRNFFSVDTRTIPTPTAWTLGEKSAALLVERYMQDNGDYPSSLGLSVWGTATMRTGGDDIAQAFALLGVRPKWAEGSHRVTDFEVIPVPNLGRPRVDVTLRVSGFFRDAFSGVMQMFDAAVQAIAGLDEPEEANPIRVRIERDRAVLQAEGIDEDQALRRASFRIFGAKPGAYGAGLQGVMDSQNWADGADLARAYLNWGGYAYGQKVYGEARHDTFAQRLSTVQAVVQNQDNREHDLLDSDDYYQFQGGMSAAVEHASGVRPALFFGDHSNPESPRIRGLDEELSRVVRARVTNPKWIEGMQRHGYKGAFEMAASVDFLFAFDATTGVVRDDQYASVTDALIENTDNRAFLERHNPEALRDMSERLLEAIGRGLWAEPGDYRERLESHLLNAERHLED